MKKQTFTRDHLNGCIADRLALIKQVDDIQDVIVRNLMIRKKDMPKGMALDTEVEVLNRAYMDNVYTKMKLEAQITKLYKMIKKN